MRSSRTEGLGHRYSPLRLFAFIDDELLAFKFLDEIDQIIDLYAVIRGICGVVLIERNLMKVGVIQKLLQASQFARKAAVDRTINAADTLGSDSLKYVNVSFNGGRQTKTMDAVNGLKVVRRIVAAVEING